MLPILLVYFCPPSPLQFYSFPRTSAPRCTFSFRGVVDIAHLAFEVRLRTEPSKSDISFPFLSNML